jgi:hypothetical protein
MGVSGQHHAPDLDAGARRKILCPCQGSNPNRPARVVITAVVVTIITTTTITISYQKSFNQFVIHYNQKRVRCRRNQKKGLVLELICLHLNAVKLSKDLKGSCCSLI